MWQHLSTVSKLKEIAVMQLSAKFLRGTHVWPISILQILKILLTENKTKHSYYRVIICINFIEIAEINSC